MKEVIEIDKQMAQDIAYAMGVLCVSPSVANPERCEEIGVFMDKQVALLQPCSACGGSGEVPIKNQSCGCIICTCEDEEQCQGCGAKYCENHNSYGNRLIPETKPCPRGCKPNDAQERQDDINAKIAHDRLISQPKAGFVREEIVEALLHERMQKELKLKDRIEAFEREIANCRALLEGSLDRDKDPKDSLRDLVSVAVNALWYARASKKHFICANLKLENEQQEQQITELKKEINRLAERLTEHGGKPSLKKEAEDGKS